MNTRKHLARLALAGALLAMAGFVTGQQAYPTKPVRIIVPFPPGGALDVAGRMLATQMAQSMDQSVLVENRAGGNGNIGADAVAKSRPDGYTLLFTPGTLVISRVLYRAVPFDPIADFEPVGTVVKLRYGVIANARVPANNLRELVAYAKANPGKLSYGSTGQGTMPHLAMELFKQMAGVKILEVPYKGAAPALLDVIGGHIDLVASPELQITRDGKVKALGVLTDARFADWPDIPTAAESGIPDCTSDNWQAILAPAGTPRAIVERLNAEIARALPKMDAAQLAKFSQVSFTGSPQSLAALMKQDQAKWTRLIQELGIKPE